MKVQEVLENYNSLKASITITEGEIQELENEILDCKSSNLDGMPKPKGFVTSNIEAYVAEKQEKIEQKQRYIDRTKTKIKIPEKFSKPNPKKMQKKYNYYRKNHKLESQIIIDPNYNLIDGYTSYLIAKECHIATVIGKLQRKVTINNENESD